MGTDIHIVAEVYNKTEGKWHLSEAVMPSDRNYWAFAIMADVRNGYGFAGVSIGGRLTPIDNPRGLPSDISEEAKEVYLGDHSRSYLTLYELMDYDMSKDMIQRGVVSHEQAKKYKEKGIQPEIWSAFCSNMEGLEHLEWGIPMKEAAWLLPLIIEALKPLGNPREMLWIADRHLIYWRVGKWKQKIKKKTRAGNVPSQQLI